MFPIGFRLDNTFFIIHYIIIIVYNNKTIPFKKDKKTPSQFL